MCTSEGLFGILSVISILFPMLHISQGSVLPMMSMNLWDLITILIRSLQMMTLMLTPMEVLGPIWQCMIKISEKGSTCVYPSVLCQRCFPLTSWVFDLRNGWPHGQYDLGLFSEWSRAMINLHSNHPDGLIGVFYTGSSLKAVFSIL